MSKIILTNPSKSRLGFPSKTKDSTRSELAIRAANFFAQQGYHGTSTQTIAQSCSIRKASLFHHYKTKEDIALAAMDYVSTYCHTHIFKHADTPNVSNEHRINSFLEACEQFFTQRIDSLLPTLLGLELVEFEFFTKAVTEYFQSWVDALTRLLSPLCKSDSKAKRLAEESVVRMQGHMVVARIQKDQQYLTNMIKELRDFWLAAAHS